MTDRELLELAAKAAGIDYEWQDTEDYWAERNKWNPLTDDGDRYRLARTCRLTIDFAEGYVVLPDEYSRAVISFTPCDKIEEAYAIVRAAAEIGRNMK